MKQPIKLKHELIDSSSPPLNGPKTFQACLNAHGTYTTEHFVLRLSPRVHTLISSVPTGIHSTQSVDSEVIQAYSTYIHETIHWWQHMGSTAGLVFSLCYPAQTHVNLKHLSAYLKKVGPQKSIRTWAENALRQGRSHEDDSVREANIVVNNAIDVEFYKLFSFDPSCAEAMLSDRYFESIGHSYWMAYGHLMSMLSATFDQDFQHFPDARIWDTEFPKLKLQSHEGFYHGSPIRRGPVGLKALFEGQARFCQLQYLSFGTAPPFTCDELKAQGYLSGIYVVAFEAFLKLTESDWPTYINDPIVGLFLLICDLSINPSKGFPFQIESYHDFIIDVDPGIRFANMCATVAAEHPELRSAVRDYSKEEYINISETLTASCGYDHPMQTLQEVLGWIETVPQVSTLMAEHNTFNFELTNLPVRVLFSHFLNFSADKFAHPEFFCWPGAWMAGERTSETIQKLFLTHLSLFSDKEDDDGIYPRQFPGKDPEGIKRTFNVFYANSMVYDLTRQWILNDGPFEYDYSWLSSTHAETKLENAANECFGGIHGVNPEKFAFCKTT